jgi:Flp pilus assembly protein TadG
MQTFPQDRRAQARGQSLVEFALVIPVFLLLLIGVFDLGLGVFSYNSVTNAAREGARLAIVNQDTALISQRAIAQTRIAETTAPNVTVEFRRTTPNADYRTNTECRATPDNNTVALSLDCVAVVTFQTTYRPITPIISSFMFPSGVTLTAQSIQQLEFVCPNGVIGSSASCPKQP